MFVKETIYHPDLLSVGSAPKNNGIFIQLLSDHFLIKKILNTKGSYFIGEKDSNIFLILSLILPFQWSRVSLSLSLSLLPLCWDIWCPGSKILFWLQVVKMMMMVVLIFIVCWLPYHTYFITANIYPEINYSIYIQEIYLMIYWLAMSNSMYNPMIYCYMNQR